jgi:hypothetical protein
MFFVGGVIGLIAAKKIGSGFFNEDGLSHGRIGT